MNYYRPGAVNLPEKKEKRMKKYNIKDDPRYKLVEKIFLKTGVELPMLTWSGMSEEELETYYQELQNNMTISDLAKSAKDTVNAPANLIFNLRDLTGLSQRTFSDKYRIPKRTIEDWERGKRKPPEYVVKLLERAVKEDFPNNIGSKKFTVLRNVPIDDIEDAAECDVSLEERTDRDAKTQLMKMLSEEIESVDFNDPHKVTFVKHTENKGMMITLTYDMYIE